MRGEAHLQRGTERRYYRCPTLGCRARRYPADLIEEDVLASIAEGVLPATVIDAARTELRKLLETPEVAGAGKQRARLMTRLEKLKKQHAWGDLTDAEYQAKRDATKADLAELPDGDRIRTFDAYRARVLALPGCHRGGVTGQAGGTLPDRRPAGRRAEPAAGRDRLGARGKAVLREKTAGVPPRGFEPLISTLKGWRPRPLDDGGQGRRESTRGSRGDPVDAPLGMGAMELRRAVATA